MSIDPHIGEAVDKAYSLLNGRKKGNMKEDLEEALMILLDVEGSPISLDSSLLHRIYWGLLLVEKGLSCQSGLDKMKKIEHVEQAQRYSERIILQSSDTSLRAQLSLEQQILKGRKATLISGSGTNGDVLARLRSEAVDGMDKAMEELRVVDPASFNKVCGAAFKWRTTFEQTSS